MVSGSGKAEIVSTGQGTRFGKIAESLRLRRPETEFERGVRRFGYLLAEVTLLLVLAIFGFNVFLHKPVLDSFLFALALAVGLTPQLLPAIITINLSHGARRMAQEKVIVKRLAAIENFGSMNVLCSDKTGTITEGKIGIRAAVDAQGNQSEKTMFYAYSMPLTKPVSSIRSTKRFGRIRPVIARMEKSGRTSLRFARKRLSIFCEKKDARVLVTKGALRQILAICSEIEWTNGTRDKIDSARDQIDEQWRKFSSEGSRVLAVAYRGCGAECSRIDRETEREMIFLGSSCCLIRRKPESNRLWANCASSASD